MTLAGLDDLTMRLAEKRVAEAERLLAPGSDCVKMRRSVVMRTTALSTGGEMPKRASPEITASSHARQTAWWSLSVRKA